MKIYLSKPRNHWISPYTILEKVFFWLDWDKISYDTPWVKLWSDILNPFSVGLQKFLDFVQPEIKYIKIDYHDVWSMDSTLSPIILPMLKELKRVKHGSPFSDLDDVPEHLRYTEHSEWSQQKNFEFYNEDSDKIFDKEDVGIHARWNWILDEMIWTFEQLNTDWEEQYRSGEIDHVWVKCEDNPSLNTLQHGPNHTYQLDMEGMKKHQERINNGLRLFGRYFQALWD